MNNSLLNSDTIQTIARFLLKLLIGALITHGVSHANDLDTPVMQTVLEEVLAAVLTPLSLWWSKKQQVAIAVRGNTDTFVKSDSTPGLPKP